MIALSTIHKCCWVIAFSFVSCGHFSIPSDTQAGVMPIHPRLLLEASRKREIAEEALKKNTQQTAIEAESSSNPTTENV